MSKELPYFQFEPAEYLSGDIQLCSYEAQGVFVNLMVIYWQRGCVMSLEQAQKRLKSDCFSELMDENIIKVNGEGDLIISFLDEQYDLISKRKEILSRSGRKGARIKKDKATLKPPLSHPEPTLKHLDKIREDDSREEKIKGDNIKKVNIAEKNPLHSILKQQFLDFYKGLTNEEFYWDAKNASALKQLILKTKKKLREKEIKETDEKISESFQVLLERISDKWILDNLSVAIINSKFNEIIQNGKQTTDKNSWSDWVNQPS